MQCRQLLLLSRRVKKLPLAIPESEERKMAGGVGNPGEQGGK